MFPLLSYFKTNRFNVPGIGIVRFDVAYGGAFYAICDGDKLGLKLEESNYNKLIRYGRAIKKSVMENFQINHPFENDLSFLYGTIFTGEPADKSNHSRNVCIFADGAVDRSATGSGVSARAAILYRRGALNRDEKITIESILGTTMDVRIEDTVEFGGYDSVVPEVSGKAHFTGQNEFWFDPTDELREGFILR